MQLLSSFMARHLKRGPSLKKGKRESSGLNSPVGGQPSPTGGTAAAIKSLAELPGPCNLIPLGSSKMTPDDPASDDEFTVAVAQNSLRETEALRGALYLGVSVTIAWLVGVAGLSLAWLMLVLALAGSLTKARISRLLHTALQQELARLRRRRALYKDETAEWLSILINKWWRFSAASIFSQAKERLEPLLNDAKPAILGSLELRELTLGEQTPCVTRIRTLDFNGDEDSPSNNGSRSTSTKLCVEADLNLDCEQFRMLIATRLFGKGVGMDIDLAVEKLSVSGTIMASLTLDANSPFPHASHLSLSFVEKPDVWFSVRLLRSVQMMEVPLLKTWIHAVVSDALASWLVDPGHLEIDLRAQERPGPGFDCMATTTPQAVLTVTLSQAGIAPSNDEERWLVVTIGEQRRVTSTLSANWSEDVSFLVGALDNERISIKLKAKRLVSTITLAQFELALGVYNWETSQVVETVLQQKKPSRNSTSIPNINARLEYSTLPTLEPDAPLPSIPDSMESHTAGVLVVYIHSAENLGSDTSQCNPYCLLFNNRKKVKTTHYVRGTNSPNWESRAEFLVQDYTQVSLSFVIYSWNISKGADTDMLGLAMLSLSPGMKWIVRKELTLSGSSSQSTMTVSVLFHPVRSVQQIPSSRRNSVNQVAAEDEPKNKRNSLPWMQQAKLLLTRDADTATSDVSSLLSTGSGLMEVTLLRARDLVAKDLNGFSDPFCELKLNNETKYKSSVKKKTLNPCWDESSIMGLPRGSETLDVVLWDHDTFGMKDYLGKVSLTLEEIRRLSSSDQSYWFPLRGTKSGSIELKIKVLSEECETQSTYATSTISEASTRPSELHETPVPIATNIIRRPSMEKSRMRLHLEPVVPPPPPPRTVTLIKVPKIPENHSTHSSPSNNHLRHVNHTPGKLFTKAKDFDESSEASTNHWSRKRNGEQSDCADETDDSKSKMSSSHHSLSPSPDQSFGKKTPQYNSFRAMKQKMKRGLRLRRFRSEVNIEEKDSSKGVTLSLEPRGVSEMDAAEIMQSSAVLSHAVSQPDMLARQSRHSSPKLKLRQNDAKVVNGLREKYGGVEGKVLQAQGLHVAHIAQLYCRVKFQNCTSPEKMNHSITGGKTIAKSRLLPAMPNPQFCIDFQLDHDSIPRQSMLVFEIRSATKELLASRRITLHELLGASSATSEIRTWLALNNGASLEIQIAHGREIKRSTKRLFRSWSVHRIGKI